MYVYRVYINVQLDRHLWHHSVGPACTVRYRYRYMWYHSVGSNYVQCHVHYDTRLEVHVVPLCGPACTFHMQILHYC